MPDLRALHVIRIKPQVRDVNVDKLAIGHRRLGSEAVLAMPSSRRLPRIELPLPNRLTGLKIETVQVVVQRDFLRQFDVACSYAFDHFLFAEPLLHQLRYVLIAVLGPNLRRLRLPLSFDRGEKHTAPTYNRRRPSPPRNFRRPFHVLSPRPR